MSLLGLPGKEKGAKAGTASFSVLSLVLISC